MSGIVGQKIVYLGCEPQVQVVIQELGDGTLRLDLSDIDGIAPEDIDGLFFDLVDEGLLDSGLATVTGDTGPVTGFDTGDDNQTTLANGAMVAEGYDVSVQFGTSSAGTEGTVNPVAFNIWADDGTALTLDHIDMESLALVVNSDGADGKVLLPNDEFSAEDLDEDETGDGGEDPESNTCEFTVTDPSGLEVTLSLTELETGEVQVDVTMPDGGDAVIGDIRGIFFNVADESKLDDMTVAGADVTEEEFDANDVSNLGKGNNINGEIVNNYGKFDAGVGIGNPGAGKDDLQDTSFVLSHPEGLSLEDFEGQEFALRLTSVGDADGDREGSLKLVGTCEPAPPVEECESEYDVLYQSMMVADSQEDEAPTEPVEEETELELL